MAPTRAALDDAGRFSVSLDTGTYSVAVVVAAADGSERTIRDDQANLTIVAGESFALHVAITGEAGAEKVTVEKKS